MVSHVKTRAKGVKPARKTARVSDRTPPAVRRQQLLDQMTSAGRASAVDIASALGMNQHTARVYLMALCADNLANFVVARQGKGVRERLFDVGPAADEPVKAEREKDEDAINDAPIRPRRSDWAPCHMRDPLDCFLFGFPAVLLEQRA